VEGHMLAGRYAACAERRSTWDGPQACSRIRFDVLETRANAEVQPPFSSGLRNNENERF
jgi:hypothetical protein